MGGKKKKRKPNSKPKSAPSRRRVEPTKPESEDKSDGFLVGYYCLLFIDILEQKQKLSKTAKLPKNRKERTAFIDSLRETSGLVKAFRTLFDTYFSSVTDEEITAVSSENEEERKFIQLCKKVEIKRQCFSDTMIYYAWVMEKPDRLIVSAIHNLLSGAAAGFFLTLSQGYVCRGGIEVGTAHEFATGDLYGYAMHKAHKLESEIAQYPRIAVGDFLLEIIGNELATPGDGIVAEYTRNMAKRCNDFLLRDIDGVTIVDYAGTQTKEIFKDLHGAIDPAIAFVRAKWQEFRSQGAADSEAQKLAMRYYLMYQYLMYRKQTIWE